MVVSFQANNLQFGSFGQLIRKSAGITFEYERVALGDAAVGDNPFRRLAVGAVREPPLPRIRMGISFGSYDLFFFPFPCAKAINWPFARPGRAESHIIIHQYAGPDRPQGNHSSVSDYFLIARSRSILPHKNTVAGIETIDIPIVRAYVHPLIANRGSETNRPFGCEVPS